MNRPRPSTGGEMRWLGKVGESDGKVSLPWEGRSDGRLWNGAPQGHFSPG